MKIVLFGMIVLAFVGPALASITAGIVAGGGVANIYAEDGTPLIINQGSWVDPNNPAAGMQIGQYINNPEMGATITNYVGPEGIAVSTSGPNGQVNGFIVPDPSNLPDPLVGSQTGADIQAIAAGEVMTGIPDGGNHYGWDYNIENSSPIVLDATVDHEGVEITPSMNAFISEDEPITDDVVTQVGTGSTAKGAGGAVPQMVAFPDDFGDTVDEFDPSSFYVTDSQGILTIGQD